MKKPAKLNIENKPYAYNPSSVKSLIHPQAVSIF